MWLCLCLWFFVYEFMCVVFMFLLCWSVYVLYILFLCLLLYYTCHLLYVISLCLCLYIASMNARRGWACYFFVLWYNFPVVAEFFFFFVVGIFNHLFFFFLFLSISLSFSPFLSSSLIFPPPLLVRLYGRFCPCFITRINIIKKWCNIK